MAQYLVERYSEMIKSIDKANLRIRNENNKRLTMQFYSKGDYYNGKLMVVGRAVNGWDEECEWLHGKYIDVSPDAMIEKAYEKSLINPLKWVLDSWELNVIENGEKKYNTAKSPFWQLTKDVLKAITLQNEWDEKNWARQIIWSNLYKVALAAGGNPNYTMCKTQQSFCREILKYEIMQNKPEFILFVTDNGWFEGFEDCLVETRDYYSKFLVCKRPEFNSPSKMALEISKELLDV